MRSKKNIWGYVRCKIVLKLNQKSSCMSRKTVLTCWKVIISCVKRILASKHLILDLYHSEPVKGSDFEYSFLEYENRSILDSS
jgi:hypothetical protein